jgi:hypothetical protein
MYIQALQGVGYDYATAPGGVGLDEYYRRIYAGALNFSGADLVREMDTWGITPEDVAEAFRRNSPNLPQYNPTASDIAISYAGGGGKNPAYLASIQRNELNFASQTYNTTLTAIDAAAEAALAAQTDAARRAAEAAAAAAVEESNRLRLAEEQRLVAYYNELARIEAQTRAAQDAAAAAQAQAAADAERARQAAAAAQAQAAADAERARQATAAAQAQAAAAQQAAQQAAAAAAAAAAKVAADAAAATASANAAKAKAELDAKYSWFDVSIKDKTALEKAQYFNFLKGQGKTEAQIFEAIAYWVGPQTPEAIAALKTMADDLLKPKEKAGETLIRVVEPRRDETRTGTGTLIVPGTPATPMLPTAPTTPAAGGANTGLVIAAALAALTLLG